MPLAPQTRVGAFEVLDLLGAGGPPSLVRDPNRELRRGPAAAKLWNRP